MMEHAYIEVDSREKRIISRSIELFQDDLRWSKRKLQKTIDDV